MADIPTIGWLLAIAGGALVLGLAIAYGMMNNRRRTARDKRVSERGAREIYDKEPGA